MRDALPFMEGSHLLPTLIEGVFQNLAASNELQGSRNNPVRQSFQLANAFALEAPYLWFAYADFRLSGISTRNPD